MAQGYSQYLGVVGKIGLLAVHLLVGADEACPCPRGPVLLPFGPHGEVGAARGQVPCRQVVMKTRRGYQWREEEQRKNVQVA